MKKNHRRGRILLIVFLVIIAALSILYFQRKKIVGKYVPEVTKFYSADLTWKNDSLIGVVAMGIKNKSTSLISIDSINAGIRLDTLTVLNLDQKVDIRLDALESDTLFLNVGLPVKRFMHFVGSLEHQDSVEMFYTLDILYSTKVGSIHLPIKDSMNIVAPRRVQAELVKFEYEKYHEKSIYGNLLVYIYNPGRLNLAIEDIHYTVNTNGDISTEGTYTKEVKLEPGSENIFSIPVEIKVDKPLKTLVNVISDKDTYLYSVTLNGTLKTEADIFNDCSITLHKTGSFEILKSDTADKDK